MTAHLNWQATWNFDRTVKETVEWYRIFYEQPDSIAELTKTQIQQYHHDAKTLGLGWAQSLLDRIRLLLFRKYLQMVGMCGIV